MSTEIKFGEAATTVEEVAIGAAKAAAEERGRGRVDPAADRADEIGEHREQAQHPEGGQADRQRIDPVVGELLGELSPPRGPGSGPDASLRPLPCARRLGLTARSHTPKLTPPTLTTTGSWPATGPAGAASRGSP